MSQGDQKHDTLALGVGREEINDGIVVERQPRRAKALCVSRQVDPAGRIEMLSAQVHCALVYGNFHFGLRHRVTTSFPHAFSGNP